MGYPKSEQEILNATYIESLSALRVSANITANFEVENLDAADFRTSASIMDVEYGGAANVIVSARSVTPTSAMKGLLVNAVSPDAAYMRVSAMGVNITDVSNPDAADFRVSAFSDDGGTLRISAIPGDNEVTATYLGRVSAIQEDAANLYVSCMSDDGATMRVSAVGTLTVSSHEVKQSDAAALRVSSYNAGWGYTILSYGQTISAAGDSIVWTPAAGKSIRLTDATYSSVSAATYQLYGAAKLTGNLYTTQNGTVHVNYTSPLPLSANETLGISSTDAGNTLGVTFIGYEI